MHHGAPLSRKKGLTRPMLSQPSAVSRDSTGGDSGSKIAHLRVVERVDELPVIRGVLTHGVKPVVKISTQHQKMIALLDMGDNFFHVVAIESAYRHIAIDNACAIATSFGYRKKGKSCVSVHCLNQIFKKVSEREQKNKGGIESYESEKSASILFFEEILLAALKQETSDIHFCIKKDKANPEQFEPMGMVLFRIHTRLHQYKGYPSETLIKTIRSLYHSLDATDQNSTSDTSFHEGTNQYSKLHPVVGGKKIELRYQHLVANDGMDAIMRILGGGEPKVMSLLELGYDQSQIDLLLEASSKKSGAIIIAGVTNSGKTTTQRTLLTMNPEERRHQKLYTIEDPCEYKIYGATQIAIRRSSKKDQADDQNHYGAILKDILRADPDIVMLSEIRDRETASAVRMLIDTGHLIFATTHTRSAPKIISRITAPEIGLDTHTVTEEGFLVALIYQMLLPTSCPHCKLEAAKVIGQEKVDLIGEKFGLDKDSIFCRNDKGCAACNHRGTSGMTLAAEVLSPDREFLSLWRKGDDYGAEDYWRRTRDSYFDEPGCTGKTAFEHALFKMSLGLVDPRDVEAATPTPGGFREYKIVDVQLPPKKLVARDAQILSFPKK